MKTVRILSHQIGLVFKHGNFVKTLPAGHHWLWPNEVAYVYNQGELLQQPPYDLAVLLAIPDIAARLDVVEVKDNEIVLQYEGGLFMNVLRKGRYAYWKGLKQYSYRHLDITQPVIPADVDLASLMPVPLGAYVRTYTVEAHEQGILFVDWAFAEVLKPGQYHWWKNNTPIHVLKVDMRQQQMEVSGQEILTKDKASVRVSFFIQFQVIDVVKALVENKEYDRQLYVLMQLALRETIGAMTLDELLDKKAEIVDGVLAETAGRATVLGVALKGGGLRDVILPGDVRDIMNQVLLAEKKAQANSIMRREETASTRSLLNTAKLMEDNEMLWKLKEMEYVEKIADKISSVSVSGNGQLLDQLKQIFTASKT